MRRGASSKASLLLAAAILALVALPSAAASDASCRDMDDVKPATGVGSDEFGKWDRCDAHYTVEWTGNAATTVKLLHETTVLATAQVKPNEKADLSYDDVNGALLGKGVEAGKNVTLRIATGSSNTPKATFVHALPAATSGTSPGGADTAASPGEKPAAEQPNIVVRAWDKAWREYRTLVIVLISASALMTVALVAGGIWWFVVRRQARAEEDDLLDRTYAAAPVVTQAHRPKVTFRVADADTGQQLNAYDMGLKLRGEALRSYEDNVFFQHMEPYEAAALRAADFVIENPAYAHVPERFGLKPLPSGGYSVTIAVRERRFPVLVQVQDKDQGVHIPRVSIVVRQDNGGAPVELHADENGQAKFEAKRGKLHVSLKPSGALKSDPVATDVRPEGTRVILNASLERLPPPTIDLTLTPPPGHAQLAWSDLGRSAMAEFVKTLQGAYASPALHVKAPEVVRILRPPVGDKRREAIDGVLKDVRDAFSDVANEKQVQAHLQGRSTSKWTGRFAWSLSPAEARAHLEAAALGGASDLASRVAQKRTAIEERVAQRSADLVVRPAVRLLAAADQLRAWGDVVNLMGADLVLDAIQTFLTDAELANEWRRA